jgi:hypothetical protein
VQLDIGKAVRFDMKRNEWCKQDNLLAIYYNVYCKLAEKGIAKELDEEVMLDKKRKNKAFNYPPKHADVCR